MPQEDKDRLVAVFEWLLEEDKKQNPDLYKGDAVEKKTH